MSGQSNLERRLHQQEVVAELGKQALETDDFDHLLHDVCEAVASTLDNEYCAVLELSSAGGELLLREGVGWRAGEVGSTSVSTDLDSQATHALTSEEPVIVDDWESEARFTPPELLARHSVASGVAVTIGPVDNPWGVLGTHTTEHGGVTESDGAFVQNVANLLASAIDRHERQRELSRYRALTEAVNDVIVTIDEESVIQSINPAVEDMFGYEPKELVSSSLTALMPDELADRHRSAVERYLETGERTLDWDRVELAGQHADGTRIQLAISFSVREVGGEAIFTGIIRDITGRKEQEREHERLLDLLQHTERIADVGGWEIDPETMEVFWSDHIYELLGVENDGQPDLDQALGMYPEKDRVAVQEAIERALERGESMDLEARIRRTDGELRWLALLGEPRVEEGEVVALRGAAQDITERKERERELEKSEQRHRTLVENFPNGVVALVDEDLRYVTAGGATEEVAGLEVEEVEGSRVGDIVPDPLAERIVSCYKAAFEGESSSFEGEYDGRINQFHIVPVRDDDGKIFAALGMSQDVTERRESKRKLEESERRYRTLVENFPNGAVALFNDNLEYTTAGGELLENIEIEGPVGDSVLERYPDELVADIEPHFRAAINGEAREFEMDFLDRHLLARTLPVWDAEGDPQGGMIVVLDVTERREYREQLEESHERLEEFASAISHDLREPLGTVANYLQLLERRYEEDLDEDAQEFVEFAISGATRMREMIDGLVTTYARLEDEADPFKPVNLETVWEDVTMDLSEKIESTDAHITSDSLPEVIGDRGQLQQVLMNLLDNALKYSGEEPPRVDVTAEHEDGMYRISVSDEGTGVTPAASEKIFDVFSRAHPEDEYPGIGIGLAICDRIVERHNGEIWVESEPGEGATFSFTVPAA